MSNDLMFLNTYTEVMLENVTSVIKQNFMFQTQLKLAETKLAQLDDAKKQADNLLIQNRELQSKVNELTSLTGSYKNVADDKSRLQVSLNETSQAKNQLQADLNAAQQELTRLRGQVSQFDELKKQIAELTKERDGLKAKLETPVETAVKVPVAKVLGKKQDKASKATAGTF